MSFFGWPGQLVVRVRERGIASAQEVTEGIRQSTVDLLWPAATRTINCPGHLKLDRRPEVDGYL